MLLLKRYQQTLIWLVVAPALGLVQAMLSFAWLFVKGHEREVLTLVASIGVVYGTGWFLPALLICDFAFVRRSLSWPEFRNFTSVPAGMAAIIGLLPPGILVMIGYPISAVAIVLLAAVRFRTRRTS